MSPRKFDRFMVDVNVGTNRKLRRLTIPERLCHLAGILPVAAQAPIRGRLLVGNHEATPKDYAELAGVGVKVAQSAVTKLRDGGIIVPDEENDCERIHDWDDWNPEPKRDPTNADRQRRYRETRNATRNGPVTPVTGNAVTPGREEKTKEELANAPSSRSARSAADKKRRQIEKATDEDRRLCRLLAELLRDRNPKAKIGDMAEWLTNMRLLRERDENTPAEIEEVIRWVFRHHFWSGVIESPASLREHFPKLWGQIHAPLQAVQAVEDSAAYLARRGAA